jgi:hypothetical protein
MPRPTKFTAARRERILEALRHGVSFEVAAQCGGVSRDTFQEWRKANPDFAQECETARAEMCVRMLEFISNAANDPKHWQAAAWILERTEPEQFGRRAPLQVEMSGRDGKPIAMQNSRQSSLFDKLLDGLPLEKLREIAEAEDDDQMFAALKLALAEAH